MSKKRQKDNALVMTKPPKKGNWQKQISKHMKAIKPPKHPVFRRSQSRRGT